MSTRTQIGDAIREAMPDTASVLVDVRDLGEIDPAVTAVVQIIRERVENINTVNLIERFELWVVDPHTDPTLLEDYLDDSLDAVLEAINGLDWLLWTQAERAMHPSGNYHAYKITVHTQSYITNEE